jgi:DUF1009 family protein
MQAAPLEIKKLGIIAGNGVFPRLVAEGASANHIDVFAVAHRDESLPELEDVITNIHWIKVGQVGRMLKYFKKNNITHVCMAGGLNKSNWIKKVRPDLTGLRLIASLLTKNDDSILRKFASFFNDHGIEIIDGSQFIPNAYVPAGVLIGAELSEQESHDARLGFKIAKNLGLYDVGQTVILKEGVVVALEAVEGTDAALQRASKLVGDGTMCVKVSKPHQDLRFDQPAIGPNTIEQLHAVGCNRLIVEAQKTLFLDFSKIMELAQKYDLTIVALD